MDFFQHQDDAQRASRRLVVYFAIAVGGLAIGVHLAGSAIFYWMESGMVGEFSWFALDRFVFFAGGTLFVVLCGSLYKTWRLSRGGGVVAQLLGGRPLDPNTTDPLERRARNVVEEMALAAGVPVPTIYILDREDGINAFAAGLSTHDAVVGITRGSMEQLSRDELQGVIAHEFSHILNGDMRLNLRLMGVVHGILVIGLLGYYILRAGARSSGSSKQGGAGAALPLIGLALLIIGYTGVFFARVIKSAVSRQREFLADASAVQFTRNPLGIGNALKKIGSLTTGSVVMSPHAEQASHFFFSGYKDGKVRQALSGSTSFAFLATHPPLKERIRRIDPRWDGVFPEVQPQKKQPLSGERAKAQENERREKAKRFLTILPAQLMAAVGTVDEQHIAYAQAMLGRIPETVKDAVHEPAGARAVVLALLVDREPEFRERQLQLLWDANDEPLAKETRSLAELLGQAPREIRLPLVDLAIPSLRRLSPEQYASFMTLVDAFIRADEQIDLFEYTLSHILKRHLEPTFEAVEPPRIEFYALNPLRQECSVLISAMAHAGHKDEADARRAFTEGTKEIEGIPLEFQPRARSGLVAVRDALYKLDGVAPRLKKDLLRALVASLARDGRVTVGEGELLRTIADALGLPMPPFLPGQALDEPAKAS